MKKLKIILPVLIILTIAFMFDRSSKSQLAKDVSTLSLLNSEFTLAPCPNKPNCVSSYTPEKTNHYISKIKFKNNNLNIIDDFFKNCKLIQKDLNYRYYTCQSKFFGFVDDIEILHHTEVNKIGFRSASRVGHSDLGANRARIEKLIDFIQNH